MRGLNDEDVKQCRAVASAWAEEIDYIVSQVSRHTKQPKEAILGKRRGAEIDRARQIAMYVAKREGVPESALAKAFGRDRSSITHNIGLEAKRRKEAAE